MIKFLIFAGALSRLIPHPANFTPIIAIALFGGFYLKNFKHSILIVFASMFLSDIIIGFYKLMPVVYLALFIPILIGQYTKRATIPWILGGSLVSSLSFFTITNFAVWFYGAFYPKTFSGLSLCYEAGIPFLKNQIGGDLFYSVVLFGLFYLCRSLSSAFGRGYQKTS